MTLGREAGDALAAARVDTSLIRPSVTNGRFAPGVEENGHLKDVGRGWHFDYEDGYEDDEPLYKLDRHQIRTGEYLSVTEHDGVTRPYRIASVAPV